MTDALQHIEHLKHYLESRELTNTPLARELHDGYVAVAEEANRRLFAYDALIKQGKKMEAHALAVQTPPLEQVVQALQDIPNQKTLRALEDLYDWPMPEEMPESIIAALKLNLGEMAKLQPTLAEYRRIARTGSLSERLALLRQLCELEPENPDWRTLRNEAEEQLLPELISQAQTAIQNKDYARLAQVESELRNDAWSIQVPDMVLDKIRRVLTERHQLEVRQKAAELLTKVNDALSMFDAAALERALGQWDALVAAESYAPDANEQQQLREARAYLKERQEQAEREETHRKSLQDVVSNIQNNASVEDVENALLTAQQTGIEIPDYILSKARTYRDDHERTERIHRIFKGITIFAAAVIILVMLAWLGKVILWHVEKKNMATHISALIQEYRLDESKAYLEEIMRKHPDLKERDPEFHTMLTSRVSALETDIEGAMRKFEEYKEEVAHMLKESPVDHGRTMQVLDACMQLKVTENAKPDIVAFVNASKAVLQQYAIDQETQFLKALAAIPDGMKRVKDHLRMKNFTEAQKSLASLDELSRQLQTIADTNPSLVFPTSGKTARASLDEQAALLTNVNTLATSVTNARITHEKVLAAQNAVFDARDIKTLANALSALKTTTDAGENYQYITTQIQALKLDIDVLSPILNYIGSGADAAIPSAQTGKPFFKDLHAYRTRVKAFRDAITQIRGDADDLMREVNGELLRYLRIRMTGSNEIREFYFTENATEANKSVINPRFEITSLDDQTICLWYDKRAYDENKAYRFQKGRFKSGIDSSKLDKCLVECPEKMPLTELALNQSNAPHLNIIEQLHKQTTSMREKNNAFALLPLINDGLTQLRMETYCDPWWRLRLALVVVSPLSGQESEPLLRPYFALLKRLNAMKDEVNRDNLGRTQENRYMREKQTQLLSQLDFMQLKKIAKWFEIRFNIYEALENWPIEYLGITTEVNGKITVNVSNLPQNTVFDVFCLDDSRTRCLFLGQLSRGSIQFYKGQTLPRNRVLFVSPVQKESMREKTLALKAEARLNEYTGDWPAFWPKNLVEEK